MLIPLGILASSGGGAAGSFDLISTTLLSASQASVTFDVSTYATTYKHLQIRMVARSSRSEVNDDLMLRFNSDSGTNYAQHRLYGTGTSVVSNGYTSQNSALMGVLSGNTNTANAYSATVIDLLDVFSTTKNKTIRGLNGVASSFNHVQLASSLWMNTAAVTSVQLLPITGPNFVSGSRFSLYGIKG